jgi:hypothetical protein
MEMKYVMASNWEGHWDKLPRGRTYYTLGMFRGKMNENMIGDNVETVFIKVNKSSKEIEKAWIGRTSNFKKEEKNTKKVIYFTVTLDREIECPEAYRNYTVGWYLGEATEAIQPRNDLDPPFFEALRKSNSWKEFEDYTFYLMKLIGINQVLKYEEQKGQPDGFFIIKNLAVIYDCTLEKAFEPSKEQQIKNYASVLQGGKIEFGSLVKDVSHCTKQVWIITRGSVRTLKHIDEVHVKEVPISNILELYSIRLLQNLSEDELENKLRNI